MILFASRNCYLDWMCQDFCWFVPTKNRSTLSVILLADCITSCVSHPHIFCLSAHISTLSHHKSAKCSFPFLGYSYTAEAADRTLHNCSAPMLLRSLCCTSAPLSSSLPLPPTTRLLTLATPFWWRLSNSFSWFSRKFPLTNIMRGECYFVSKLSCGELTGEKLLALGDVATVSNNSIIKSTAK